MSEFWHRRSVRLRRGRSECNTLLMNVVGMSDLKLFLSLMESSIPWSQWMFQHNFLSFAYYVISGAYYSLPAFLLVTLEPVLVAV